MARRMSPLQLREAVTEAATIMDVIDRGEVPDLDFSQALYFARALWSAEAIGYLDNLPGLAKDTAT